MPLAIVCSYSSLSRSAEGQRDLLRCLRWLGSQRLSVFVVELAYDDDSYLFPQDDPAFFHFRTERLNALWHRENLLNLAAVKVPVEYDKVAWIDPAIFFMTADWATQAEAALDTYCVLQLFSWASKTDIDGRCLEHAPSSLNTRLPATQRPIAGYAWAARREFWNSGNGLCENAVWGNGQELLVRACLQTPPADPLESSEINLWLNSTAAWIRARGGAGFLPGSIVYEGSLGHPDRHPACFPRPFVPLHRREDGLLEFAPAASAEVRNAVHTNLMRLENTDPEPAHD